MPKRLWPRAGWGVILTLGAVAAVELLSHTIYRPATPTLLLAVVAYVAFRWGRRASLVSAGMVSLYGAYYYRFPAHILENVIGDALRLGALLATSAIVALLVGDLRHAVRSSEERLRQQAAVAELGRRGLAIRDHATLINAAVQLVADTLDVECTRIMELLPDGHALVLRAGAGWGADLVGRAIVEADDGSFAGYTLRSKGPVIARDLRGETRFRLAALQREHQIVSSVSVIVAGHDQPFGVLCVDTTEPRVFSGDDVDFLQAIARVLTAGLERLALERDLVIERAAAERLAELDRLRTEFIGSVSHDLRTPLTAARAGLGLIETSAGDQLAPNERQLLRNVRRNVERLRTLIDDLLALNQVEAGVVQLDSEPLDLRTVVVDALAEVHPLIRQKEQSVEIDLPEPLAIAGDRQRLMQVVTNLLANAQQHTPPGTRITVSGWIGRGDVRLAIRDTGPGIPPNELEAVFQRFHRLGAPNTGSGLGLAIARSIIELHGGRIWAESAPEAGATFQVALPQAVDAQGQLPDLAAEV